MSANPQALGAALYTLGQGISGASDAYFGGQIKAAQTAQETALKTMQIQAQAEQRANAQAETARYHTADLAQKAAAEKDRVSEAAAKLTQTEKYQSGELGLRGQEVGLRGQEVANSNANAQASLAERTRHDQASETISAGKTPMSHSQLPVLKTQIEESDKTINGIQKQMATAGSYSDSYKGLQAKLQAEQAKRDDLMKQLNSLSMPSVAPMTNPQAPAPTAPKPEAPRASATSAANPAHVASQSDYDALPAGAFFINPSDGKVYQKKG